MKGQTALEYLMTYGWAILIVVIAIAALYFLGLTKPCRWTGTQYSGFTGGGFEVSLAKFSAASGLTFDLKRIGATTITVTSATATVGSTTQTYTPTGGSMSTGAILTPTFTGFTVTSGDCFQTQIVINYNEGGRSFTATGSISGTVEA